MGMGMKGNERWWEEGEQADRQNSSETNVTGAIEEVK